MKRVAHGEPEFNPPVSAALIRRSSIHLSWGEGLYQREIALTDTRIYDALNIYRPAAGEKKQDLHPATAWPDLIMAPVSVSYG